MCGRALARWLDTYLLPEVSPAARMDAGAESRREWKGREGQGAPGESRGANGTRPGAESRRANGSGGLTSRGPSQEPGVPPALALAFGPRREGPAALALAVGFAGQALTQWPGEPVRAPYITLYYYYHHHY